MNEKERAAEIFANIVCGFNTYVEMTTTYFDVENFVRQAGFAELKDVADAKEIYIGDDTTLDELREGILSSMKSDILNAALTFKKTITTFNE